jgi:hypothetical protein
MREVKFRAFDKTANSFVGGWVMYPDGNCEYPQGGWDLGGFYEEKDNFIIMQYTGLKDKSGVDIYEGDVLSCDVGRNEIVEFKQAMFYCRYRALPLIRVHYLNEDLEVIGNIHENPELL